MGRQEEMEKGLAALLTHALYSGAAYPKELQNVEEGHVKAEDPAVLQRYLEIAQEYDREVLKLHQEMMQALMEGKSARAIVSEFTRKQVQIGLDSLRRELALPIQWSEEAKEEIRQGLAALRAEAAEAEKDQEACACELQELIQLLEEMLSRR
jgi:replicative superfamily II helicase